MTTELVKYLDKFEMKISGKKIKTLRGREFLYTVKCIDTANSKFIFETKYILQSKADRYNIIDFIYKSLFEHNNKYGVIYIQLDYDKELNQGYATVELETLCIPNISVLEWINLLQDKTLFNNDYLKFLKRIMCYSIPTNEKLLSKLYGGAPLSYSFKAAKLTQLIAEKIGYNLNRFNREFAEKFILREILIDSRKEYVLAPNIVKGLSYINLSNIEIYTNPRKKVLT